MVAIGPIVEIPQCDKKKKQRRHLLVAIHKVSANADFMKCDDLVSERAYYLNLWRLSPSGCVLAWCWFPLRYEPKSWELNDLTVVVCEFVEITKHPPSTNVNQLRTCAPRGFRFPGSLGVLLSSSTVSIRTLNRSGGW